MILRTYLIVICLLLASCVDSARSRRVSNDQSGDATATNAQYTCINDVATDASVQCITGTQSPEVELTHFVDPFDGSYTRKLSLPKNYDGELYIAGLNIGTLADKNLKVRFSLMSCSIKTSTQAL